MPPTDAWTREPPLKVAVWAVSAFLAVIGLLFGMYAGVPWPSKDVVAQMQRDVIRLDRADEESRIVRDRNTLAIQGLQYEVRQFRDQITWATAELESLRAYVYPQRTGRVLPPPKPTPSPRSFEP